MKAIREVNAKQCDAVVIVKTNEGSFHQVLLDTKEAECVMNVINIMHDGKIKVIQTELKGVEF